jgi:sugar phosphate isomerase/epimerase
VVKMTMLNSMAAIDFVESLEKHKEWGLTELDLKDRIFDKSVIELTDSEALQAKEEISKRGLSVYCMSTGLLHDDIEKGEQHFREQHLDKISDTLRIAHILKPAVIRLLSAKSSLRNTFDNSVDYVEKQHPWLLAVYREAIDAIHDAGFAVTIENEHRDNIFSSPEEITGFFDLLDRKEKVTFTYDVQNLWEMGTYPTLEAYRKLSGYIGYFHLKGGQSSEPGAGLEWKSALDDATWPVIEITRQAIADGVSPVICLNPSHGKKIENYDYSDMAKRDLDFIRKQISEVE